MDLGLIPASNNGASGVSADGAVVVGTSGSGAFRWTQGGVIYLGTLLGPPPGNSFAYATSADGSFIVGSAEGGSGEEAFRWTETGGMNGLGFLPGQSGSVAAAVSADGSVVVGGSAEEAFIWDPIQGMRRLQDVLVAQGADLTGWTLNYATGLSADGRTIVGIGTNPNDETEAWVAIIPEPGTILLLGMGLAGLAARRRLA